MTRRPMKQSAVIHMSRTTPRMMEKAIAAVRAVVADGSADRSKVVHMIDQLTLINNMWPGSTARSNYCDLMEAIGRNPHNSDVCNMPWPLMNATTTFKRTHQNLDQNIAATWFRIKDVAATAPTLGHLQAHVHHIVHEMWGVHPKDLALPTHFYGFTFIRHVVANCLFFSGVKRSHIAKIINKDGNTSRDMIARGHKLLEGITDAESIDTCRFAPNDKSIRRVSARIALRDIEARQGGSMGRAYYLGRSNRTQRPSPGQSGEQGGGSSSAVRSADAHSDQHGQS